MDERKDDGYVHDRCQAHLHTVKDSIEQACVRVSESGN